jgi:hypothetical protein
MSEKTSLSNARSKKRKRLKKEKKEKSSAKLDARSETIRGKCKVLGS